MSKTSITARLGAENFVTQITNGQHTIIGDEPLNQGGQEQGLDPYELVLAGLALCKAATMRMYAQRKGWDAGEITVQIELETAKDQPPKFTSFVQFGNNLPDEQKRRIVEIGDRCPTHRLLEADKVFESVILQNSEL